MQPSQQYESAEQLFHTAIETIFISWILTAPGKCMRFTDDST